jgi:hypothetical protein
VIATLRSWVTTPWRLTVVGVGIILFLAAVAFGYVQSASLFHASNSYDQKALACQTRVLGLLPQTTRDAATVSLLEKISSYCYDDLLRNNSLGESTIRRGLYIHQRAENNIILFMVVLITLSGVALAGVQLLTSYNLAATGHAQGDGATDLALEQGKLSIKSSVTGLIVLAISLAFFCIYVFYVYSIKPDITKAVTATHAAAMEDKKPDNPTTAAAPLSGNIDLDSGGLDPSTGPAATTLKR